MEGYGGPAFQPLGNGLSLRRPCAGSTRAVPISVTERRTISGNTGCPEMKEAAKVK
jgi:hypothetical protein